jgi:hypothetical protein
VPGSDQLVPAGVGAVLLGRLCARQTTRRHDSGQDQISYFHVLGSPALATDELFVRFRIPSPLDLDMRGSVFDGTHIVRGEVEIRSADVLLKPMQLRGPCCSP